MQRLEKLPGALTDGVSANADSVKRLAECIHPVDTDNVIGSAARAATAQRSRRCSTTLRNGVACAHKELARVHMPRGRVAKLEAVSPAVLSPELLKLRPASRAEARVVPPQGAQASVARRRAVRQQPVDLRVEQEEEGEHEEPVQRPRPEKVLEDAPLPSLVC